MARKPEAISQEIAKLRASPQVLRDVTIIYLNPPHYLVFAPGKHCRFKLLHYCGRRAPFTCSLTVKAFLCVVGTPCDCNLGQCDLKTGTEPVLVHSAARFQRSQSFMAHVVAGRAQYTTFSVSVCHFPHAAPSEFKELSK